MILLLVLFLGLAPCGFKILTRTLPAATVSKLRVSHIPSDMYLGKSINRKSRDCREASLYYIVLETRYVFGSRYIVLERGVEMNTVASFIRPFIRLFSFVFVQRTTRRNFTVVGKKQKQDKRSHP